MIRLLLIVALLFTLPACSLMQDKQTLITIGTQYVVIKTINKSAEPAKMAERARLVVDYTATLLAGDVDSVDQLDTAVRVRIHWNEYDEADRLLISTALTAAKQDLLNAVGPDGKLNPDKVSKAQAVLKDIRQAIDMSGY